MFYDLTLVEGTQVAGAAYAGIWIALNLAMLPSIVAFHRRSRFYYHVLALNVLAGVLVFPWIAALLIAWLSDTAEPAPVEAADTRHWLDRRP